MASDISAGVRRFVSVRAGQRCEYCLIHEDDSGYSHQIDHVLSRKHGGASLVDNLAYCCAICNRLKGSDIAALDDRGWPTRLFHPRTDSWKDHFQVDGATILPSTSVGEATVRLLKMNLAERVEERRILQLLGGYPRQWKENA